jgi:NAD(P)-dependent dehydrogenase (short-subunit alcohol dehydrogenase family)
MPRMSTKPGRSVSSCRIGTWKNKSASEGKMALRRLDNKVILIAGGAGGIGSATAIRLAAEGASIVVGDINRQAAQDVVARIRSSGGIAEGFHLDISSEDSVRAFVDLGVDKFGGIDGLHANAAFLAEQHRDVDILNIDLDFWDRVIQVNLKGYVYCTRFALPLMLQRGAGAIVYMSSGAAFVGEDVRVAYAASKAGVNALMRHVASGWGKQGIRSNAIAPGLVTSPTVMALPQDFRDMCLAANRSTRLGDPADITSMVAMLMSDDGNWVQGQVLSVDGGQTMR